MAGGRGNIEHLRGIKLESWALELRLGLVGLETLVIFSNLAIASKITIFIARDSFKEICELSISFHFFFTFIVLYYQLPKTWIVMGFKIFLGFHDACSGGVIPHLHHNCTGVVISRSDTFPNSFDYVSLNFYAFSTDLIECRPDKLQVRYAWAREGKVTDCNTEWLGNIFGFTDFGFKGINSSYVGGNIFFHLHVVTVFREHVEDHAKHVFNHCFFIIWVTGTSFNCLVGVVHSGNIDFG